MWIRVTDNSMQRLVNLDNASYLCVAQENSYGPWCLMAVFTQTAPQIPQNATHIVIRRGTGVDAISFQDMTYALWKIEEKMKAEGDLCHIE